MRAIVLLHVVKNALSRIVVHIRFGKALTEPFSEPCVEFKGEELRLVPDGIEDRLGERARPRPEFDHEISLVEIAPLDHGTCEPA